jgi:OPA family glycerol-3-phosphate transporter-like MFS transporter
VAGLTLGAVVAIFALGHPGLAWAVVFMSLCVIGVHGMLSGTASMDFGGSKNAGIVTGVIDGFV